MNIDYEAIAKSSRAVGWDISAHGVQAIIEAYEEQKKAPEWVPLDLSTVKQGQEVRYIHWSSDVPPVLFVCTYGRSFVTDNGLEGLAIRGRLDWLMRAPKPKMVRVQIFKSSIDSLYMSRVDPSFTPTFGWECVGEGDIEVRE